MWFYFTCMISISIWKFYLPFSKSLHFHSSNNYLIITSYHNLFATNSTFHFWNHYTLTALTCNMIRLLVITISLPTIFDQGPIARSVPICCVACPWFAAILLWSFSLLCGLQIRTAHFNTLRTQQTWPTFCRQHFQNCFLEWNLSYL